MKTKHYLILLFFLLGFINTTYSQKNGLLWSTYFNDTNVAGNQTIDVATDRLGNVYITGYTTSNTGIATKGAYQTSYSGGTYFGDTYLAKFNSAGKLMWGTYFGGSGDELPAGITTDKSGNIFITGSTTSSSGIATKGAYQTSYGGSTGSSYSGDAYLAKFDTSGKLLWATYYGSFYDEVGSGIATDTSNNVYMVGGKSGSAGTFAFLVKFNQFGGFLWDTLLGNHLQVGDGVAIDPIGDVYITGYTRDQSGIATSGAYQTSYSGGQNSYLNIGGDAFLSKLDSSGKLLWSTYYGGNDNDVGTSLITDNKGNVYVTGFTYSDSGIATSGAYQTFFGGKPYWENASFPGGDAFLAKFNNNGNIDWATYYGGERNEIGVGISQDIAGNIYITGNTYSSNLITTSGSYQTSFAGTDDSSGWLGGDAFLAKFSNTGKFLYGSYFGGRKDDWSEGVATNSNNVYITGGTYSGSGIVTSGAFKTNADTANGNGFLAKFHFKTYIRDAGVYSVYDPEQSLCKDSLQIRIGIINYGSDTLKSVKLNWSFNNVQQTPYYWTGHLLTDSTYTISLGKYKFHKGKDTIIAWTSLPNGLSDSFPANDTVKKIIKINVFPKDYIVANSGVCSGEVITIGNAPTNGIHYFWKSNPIGVYSTKSNPTVYPIVTSTFYLEAMSNDGCKDSDSTTVSVYTFPVKSAGNDTSICAGSSLVIGKASINDITYSWTSNPSGFTSLISNPSVNPNNTTTYYLTITSSCGSRLDSVIVKVLKSPNANTGKNHSVCLGDSTSLGSSSISGNTYSWLSTPSGYSNKTSDPTVSPTTTTTYILIETITSTGCTKTDSVVITVKPLPTASFTTNTTGLTATCKPKDSLLASYSWNFGDGTKDTAREPKHTYPSKGIYTISLTATDSNGCSSTDSLTITITNTSNYALPPSNFILASPNPFTNILTLKGTGFQPSQAAISITDLQGRPVYIKNTYLSSNFKEELNLSQLQSGLYILKIISPYQTYILKISKL